MDVRDPPPPTLKYRIQYLIRRKPMIKKTLLLLLFSNSLSYAESTAADEVVLRKLNIEITSAEDKGDIKKLESVLASQIGFRRANGIVIGKEQFLKDVKPRDATKTEIESIQFFGKNRALVTCIVKMKIDKQDAKFHNVRLFIREGSEWKLLGWANERL